MYKAHPELYLMKLPVIELYPQAHTPTHINWNYQCPSLKRWLPNLGHKQESREPKWWRSAMSWMYSLFFQRVDTRLLVPVLCLTFIYSSSVLANDIAEFEVKEEEGVFYINASVVLHVSAEYVRGVLTDYVHIYRLNPSIIENEILATSGDNVTRVRTKVIACVAFYCEEIERVEDVRILASGDIQAEIVPEYSQFKSGVTLWQIRSMGEDSRLSYHAEMEPDFFIPPVIGNSIVKNKLRDEIMISFTRLERIAIIQFERDWNPGWTFTDQMDINNTKASELSGEDKE